MRSDLLFPVCTEPGRLVWCDEAGHELAACRAPACEVVEYDVQLIRSGDAVADVPAHRAWREDPDDAEARHDRRAGRRDTRGQRWESAV